MSAANRGAGATCTAIPEPAVDEAAAVSRGAAAGRGVAAGKEAAVGKEVEAGQGVVMDTPPSLRLPPRSLNVNYF